MTPSWIILTMGDRPEELAACIESISTQDVTGEIVLVVNGAVIDEPPEGVVLVMSDTNVGIPEGRNLGAEAATGDVLLFLDDDAFYDSDNLTSETLALFSADPQLAVVSFHIQDDAGSTARRHVPRAGSADPNTSAEVTTFLGGASAVRRDAFFDVGRYAGDFFYSHEESDLAWRLLDRGYRLWYAADLVVRHPAPEPARHASGLERTARNRVWLARRRLPWILAAVHIATWTVLLLLRSRSVTEARAVLSGTVSGFGTVPGPRDPISWSTALRMTKLGRPPII